MGAGTKQSSEPAEAQLMQQVNTWMGKQGLNLKL